MNKIQDFAEKISRVGTKAEAVSIGGQVYPVQVYRIFEDKVHGAVMFSDDAPGLCSWDTNLESYSGLTLRVKEGPLKLYGTVSTSGNVSAAGYKARLGPNVAAVYCIELVNGLFNSMTVEKL
jgi:hypothetical protein